MSAHITATDGGLVGTPQTGAREDLLDIMSNVDVKKTPFCSLVNRGTPPRNVKVEWNVDVYDDPQEDSIVDGTDVAASDYENHASSRGQIEIYLHYQRRTARVSRLANKVSDVAGIGTEIAEALRKKSIELKRDMERVCLGDGETQAGTTSVPYKTRGLGKWIQNGAQAVLPVPAAFRTPSAQVITTAMASFAESTLQDLFQAVWDETGGDGDFKVFCGSEWKRTFTDMLTNASTGGTNTQKIMRMLQENQSTSSITNAITFYSGDFGDIEAIPCPFIGMSGASTVDKDRAYFLDMSKINLKVAQDPTPEYYEDRGAGPRFNLESIYALAVTNPLGLAKHQPT